MPTTSVDVLARLSPAVPAALAAKAASWPADREPVAPRLSASVVLVRQASDELEVYLLHRHARMAFAASMVVFPGGGLDPVDEGADDPIRACAVRETLEETGVRLEPAALRDWAQRSTATIEVGQIYYHDGVFVVEERLTPKAEPGPVSAAASAFRVVRDHVTSVFRHDDLAAALAATELTDEDLQV